MSNPTTDPSAIDDRLGELLEWCTDDGHAVASPSQWRRLLDHPGGAPITLINLFQTREQAAYPEGHELAGDPGSGMDALARYSEVSVPTAERYGVRFILLGPVTGTWLGPEEPWDLVAVGTYPDADAVIDLFSDPGYRQAFVHRVAACHRQHVLLCAA